jgi:hypothetical protein
VFLGPKIAPRTARDRTNRPPMYGQVRTRASAIDRSTSR